MPIDPITIPIGVDLQQSLESVRDYARAIKDTFEVTTATAVEKAQRRIDEYGRKWTEVNGIIDANRKKITELSAAKEKAANDEKKQIEQEIEGLKKITNGRELELLKIDEKRHRATEVFALMTSKSKEEEDAVKKTTSALVQQIGVQKDQIRAQSQVTEETNKSNNALQNYVSGFFGLQAVGGILTSIQTSLERQRKEIQQTTEAAGKLRDLSQGETERNDTFFQEFGLNTADEKQFGSEAINSIARRYNLQPGVISKAAGNVGASLRSIGVTDFTSDRFKSLVGNAGLAEFRGVNTGLLTDVFQQNPNITGPQLNQQVQNVLALTGGSASRANQFLSTFRENRLRLGAAGIGMKEAEQIYATLAKQISPEEIPTAFQSLARAVDKLQLTPLSSRPELMQSLAQAAQGDSSEAIRLIGAAGAGPVDVKAVMAAVGRIQDPQRRQLAEAVIGGGSRGGVAMNAVANFQNVTLPTGAGQLLGATSAEELTAAQRAIARATTAEENRPSPFAERFRQEVGLQADRLKAHPEELSPLANQYSSLRTQFPNITELFQGSTEDALFKQSSQVQISQRIAGLQNLKAQRPELAPQIDALIGQYQGLLSNPDDYTNPQKVGPVIQQQEQMMGGVRSSPPPNPNQLNYQFYDPTNGRSYPIPSTQPSAPTSINIHQRNVIYGGSYDEIGGPQYFDTRYS